MSRSRSPQAGILFLTVFLDLVGFSLIFPLFPALLQDYLGREGDAGTFGALLELIRATAPEASDAHVAVLFGGAVGSLFSFLQFLCAPFWGGLSDRIGRRPVLLLTVAGLGASYLLWLFSQSFLLFVASRFLGGVMSGNISVATAAMADSTEPGERAKGMGIIGVAFGLGFILGPALGGALFALDLGGTADPGSGGIVAGGEAPAASALGLHRFSAVAGGALLLSVANWIVVATRFRETYRPDRSRREEQRTANFLKLFRPLESRGLNVTNAIWFVYLMAFSGMEFTLTFLAADRFQYTPRQNAYLFVFAGLILVFVQGGLIRRLAPLWGERRLTLVGLASVLPGFVLVGLAPREGMLFLGLALMAFGSGLLHPALTALASRYAGTDRQGYALGLFRSLGALARALGPIAACILYWRLGSAFPYLAGAGILLLPIVLAILLPPAEPT